MLDPTVLLAHPHSFCSLPNPADVPVSTLESTQSSSCISALVQVLVVRMIPH